MKTITINLYRYNELSAKAKEKAKEFFIDYATNAVKWYEFIIEDAKEVGIKILSFSLTVNDIELEIPSCITTAYAIREKHGASCNTYTIALDYTLGLHNDKSFKKFIEREYLNMLRDEYRSLTNDEAIEEMSEQGEFYFTKDGDQYVEKK